MGGENLIRIVEHPLNGRLQQKGKHLRRGRSWLNLFNSRGILTRGFSGGKGSQEEFPVGKGCYANEDAPSHRGKNEGGPTVKRKQRKKRLWGKVPTKGLS